MIYPNPLNPRRYVVVNTGLVTSGLGGGYGDWAILRLSRSEAGGMQSETVDGGVFDESWKVPTSN